MEGTGLGTHLDFEVSYTGAQLIQHLIIQDPVALEEWNKLCYMFVSSQATLRKIKELETDTDRIRRTLEGWISEKGSGATLQSFVDTLRAHALIKLADDIVRNAGAIYKSGPQQVWVATPGIPKAIPLGGGAGGGGGDDGRASPTVGVATRMGAPAPPLINQVLKTTLPSSMGKYCRDDVCCPRPNCYFNHSNRLSCPYDRNCYNLNCTSNHSVGICCWKPICVVDGCRFRHTLTQKPGSSLLRGSPASSRAPSPTPSNGSLVGEKGEKPSCGGGASTRLIVVSGLPPNTHFTHHNELRKKVQGWADGVGGRVQYVRNGEAYITCRSDEATDQALNLFNGLQFEAGGNHLNAKRSNDPIPFRNN